MFFDLADIVPVHTIQNTTSQIWNGLISVGLNPLPTVNIRKTKFHWICITSIRLHFRIFKPGNCAKPASAWCFTSVVLVCGAALACPQGHLREINGQWTDFISCFSSLIDHIKGLHSTSQQSPISYHIHTVVVETITQGATCSLRR